MSHERAGLKNEENEKLKTKETPEETNSDSVDGNLDPKGLKSADGLISPDSPDKKVDGPELTKNPELVDLSNGDLGAVLKQIIEARPDVVKKIKEIGIEEKSFSTKVEKVTDLFSEKVSEAYHNGNLEKIGVAGTIGAFIGGLTPQFILKFFQTTTVIPGEVIPFNIPGHLSVSNDYSWVNNFTHFKSSIFGHGEVINGELVALGAILGTAAGILAVKKIQSGEIPVKEGLEQLAKATGNKLVKIGQLFRGEQV